MTDFASPLYVGGVPLTGNGIPATKGKVYYVDYGSGSDGNKGTSMKQPLKTVKAAYDKTVTNMDDVIVLIGSATHALSAMLDVTKNRVHFVGLDGTARRYGQNAKISLGVTTAATDISTMKNTGVRNSFDNIKFINENTVSEGIYCVAEAGEYAVYSNTEIYKSTDLDVTGAAELLLNGDSAQFINCTLGSTANIVADNVIRPNVLLTATIAGKKARDCEFINCSFLSKAGGTEHCAVYGANATDVERKLTFRGCEFFNNPLSAATPALAISFGAAQTEGAVVVDPTSYSVDFTAMCETGKGVYTLAPSSPTYATSGKAVAA